jgi:hypothetical protein
VRTVHPKQAASFVNYALYKQDEDEVRAEQVDDACLYVYLSAWFFSHIYTALMVFWTRRACKEERTTNTGWTVLPDGRKLMVDDDGEKTHVQYRPLK